MGKAFCGVGLCLVALRCAAQIFYASPAGAHISPFNSPSSAATNIQAAVDFAQDGDTVLVLPGSYVLDAEIVVAREITILGVDGPAATVVDGGGVTRCFNLGDVACLLSGLTITNGYAFTNGGGGVACSSPSPRMTNCVLVGNSAGSGGGLHRGTAFDCAIRGNHALETGGGCHESSLHRCEVVGNQAGFSGGGINGGTAYQCVVSGNVAEFGGGVANAEIYLSRVEGNHATGESGGIDFSSAHNCLVRENTADGNGGGAGWSTLYNCTVVENASQSSGGGMDNSQSYNSIVCLNAAMLDGADIHDPAGTVHTCSPDVLHGVAGNITNAPLFAAPASGNYRLLAASPCIDSGENAHVVGAVDLDGNERIAGGAVDMGAYEFPLAAFAATGGWTPGGFVVQWPSEAGRKYAVRRSHGLPGGFEVLADGIGHPQNSFTDAVHAASSAGFYRVDAWLE